MEEKSAIPIILPFLATPPFPDPALLLGQRTRPQTARLQGQLGGGVDQGFIGQPEERGGGRGRVRKGRFPISPPLENRPYPYSGEICRHRLPVCTPVTPLLPSSLTWGGFWLSLIPARSVRDRILF